MYTPISAISDAQFVPVWLLCLLSVELNKLTLSHGGNSFFLKNYFDREVQFVGDFIDQNGNLYPFDMFMQKWNVRRNFLQ